jgi:hypothetical protein
MKLTKTFIQKGGLLMINFTGKTVFLGIDVHKKTYSVTAVCEGAMIKQDTFLASSEIFLKYCQRTFQGAKIKSAYEAGFCGFGLHRFLVDRRELSGRWGLWPTYPISYLG